MQGVLIKAPGGPEALELTTLADPEPGEGEVTIDVAYAGVGLVDVLFRRGELPIPMPIVPGIEVSGHVRALGAGVSHLKVGQAVTALLNDFVNLPGCGGYAQIALARAAITVPVPTGCGLDEAATLLVNGTAAWMALRDVARVKAGDKVLVLGAAGGLGGAVGRIARQTPAAQVSGLVGGEASRQAAQGLGYDTLFTPDELAASLKADGPFDVVIDTVGGDPRRLAFEHLPPFGRLVVLGDASGQDAAFSGNQIWLGTRTVSGLNVGGIAHIVPDQIASAANDVLSWIADRTIEAKPARVLPLAEAAEAHRLLETRKVAGKILLSVGA